MAYDRDSYDKATLIVRGSFPSKARANDIMAERFPATAAADRIVADVGLIPRGGRGTYKGPRTQGRGPHYIGPEAAAAMKAKLRRIPRTPVSDLITTDVQKARGTGAPVVDIRVWASRLQEAGVDSETIYGAYTDAGGDEELSTQQRAGETIEFLGDFVVALESRGAAQEVIVGAYQEAGGRIGR